MEGLRLRRHSGSCRPRWQACIIQVHIEGLRLRRHSASCRPRWQASIVQVLEQLWEPAFGRVVVLETVDKRLVLQLVRKTLTKSLTGATVQHKHGQLLGFFKYHKNRTEIDRAAIYRPWDFLTCPVGWQRFIDILFHIIVTWISADRHLWISG